MTVSNLVHRWIYNVGSYIRNKHINTHFHNLQKTDKSRLIDLQALQEQRLKDLLIHAKAHSKYYEEALKDIDVNDFKLGMLTSLPILSKKSLLSEVSYISIKLPEKMFLSSTSGSTGNALVFNRNLDWDASHRAAQLRGYAWHGIKPWDKNLYFWGFNPSFVKKIKIRVLDALMNRYRIFDYNEETLTKVKKIIEKVDYIEGYSSSVFSLAQKYKDKGISFNNIKMVKGTSEKIFDYYQNAVQATFNKKMISEYGAAETGIIAFECPEGKMHIAMENVIVEEVDNKILVTNLFSYSCPIVRYELGDYIRLNCKEKCSCGREHYIIDEVTGRIGELIEGKVKTYPSLTFYYVFKNISLYKGLELGYYACQSEKGKILLKVLCPEENREHAKAYISEEMEKYFDNDLDFELIFVESLEAKGRKTQSFESFIHKKGVSCDKS